MYSGGIKKLSEQATIMTNNSLQSLKEENNQIKLSWASLLLQTANMPFHQQTRDTQKRGADALARMVDDMGFDTEPMAPNQCVPPNYQNQLDVLEAFDSSLLGAGVGQT
jgi:hypothetical protein